MRRLFVAGSLRRLSRRVQILLALAVVATASGAVAASGASFVSASSFDLSAATTARSGDKMSIVGGNNQSAINGTEVSAPLQVKIVDADGKPVSDLTVTFAVATGGGSIVGATTDDTGLDGVAEVRWKLGPSPGTNTLTATCPGISSPQTLTFTATATAGQPVAIVMNAGDNQNAVAGGPVSVDPSVKVTDAGGHGCSGVSVTFVVTSGGGSLTSSATATTDSSGIASAGWKLGPTVGANTLSATSGTLSGSPVVFHATGTVGAPGKMTKTAGDLQSGQVGTALALPLKVKVTDVNDNPCSGVAVTFTPSAGSGSVTGSPATTDASGIATLGNWTLGTDLVSDTLTASAAGVTPVTFTATVEAGAATSFTLVSGNNQSAPVATTLAQPITRVVDQYNNGVRNVRVNYAVTAGNGAVTGGSVLTDVDGYASPTSWVLGTTAGTNTLTATCSSLASTLTFTATGNALAASRYVVTSSNYSPPAGSPVTITAQLADAYGNPVPTPGIQVTFAKTMGAGGSFPTPPTATTLANGAATILFTTGTAQNTQYIISATSGTAPNQRTGVSPMIVTTAAVPYRMALNAGNSQSATVNTAVATVPSVIVYDLYNNVVPNATVTFAVTSGGGSITTTSATTNASGVANCGNWTLGTKAGANTLTASVGAINGSPVTFTATATAGAATKYIVTPSTYSPAARSTITLTAQLADQYDNPVATSGIAVSWSRTGTGGQFGSTTTTTNASGIATTTYRVSRTAGRTYTFTARSTSGGTRTGTSAVVTVVASTPTQMTLYAGNNQTATVGTAVATAPSVRLRDQYGNNCANQTVAFTVTAGGGTVATTSALTTTSGVATCGGWTLGTKTGANTLTAARSGLTTVTFTATGTVGAAAKYVVTASSYTPVAGTAVTITAQLADQYGNAVATPGIVVAFTKTGNGGTFSGGGQATTTAAGVATITFTTGTPAPIAYVVTATSTSPSTRTGTSPTITTR